MFEKKRGLEKRTNSSRLNHVADGESLDRLVLGGASRAVAASDGLDVAAALLVSAAAKKLVSNLFKVSRLSRSIVVEHHRDSGCCFVSVGDDGGRGDCRRREGKVVLVLSLLDHFDGCC